MLPEEEKTTMPSHYASQGPTRAENATTSIVQKPSMLVYPSIFTFVYPTPTTSPRNRSHTLGPRQHFSAYHQPLLFSFLVLSFLLFPRIPHIPPCPLIALRCFNTASLASKNLSTQFCIHGSSFLSKPLDEMLPVIHFFQHKSVSSCTATSKMSR